MVAGGCSPRKKLLEWGWDEPDTAFLRRNLREMEGTPFDGCIFGVRHGREGAGGSFTWQFWGARSFSRDDLADAFADLRALRPRRFTENFLRVNVTPGDVDWFDDFSPILANARLAGEMARLGRARGVVLDVEQYQGPIFDYRTRKLATSRPWPTYAAQARVRGRHLMRALQEGYPGLTVFLSFGHSLPWVLTERGRQPLAETSYGLLAPFLDGMLEAARDRTRVVDGFELSYGYLEPRHFDRGSAARRGRGPAHRGSALTPTVSDSVSASACGSTTTGGTAGGAARSPPRTTTLRTGSRPPSPRLCARPTSTCGSTGRPPAGGAP